MKPNTKYTFTLFKDLFYLTDSSDPDSRTYKFNLKDDVIFNFTTGN